MGCCVGRGGSLVPTEAKLPSCLAPRGSRCDRRNGAAKHNFSSRGGLFVDGERKMGQLALL